MLSTLDHHDKNYSIFFFRSAIELLVSDCKASSLKETEDQQKPAAFDAMSNQVNNTRKIIIHLLFSYLHAMFYNEHCLIKWLSKICSETAPHFM